MKFKRILTPLLIILLLFSIVVMGAPTYVNLGPTSEITGDVGVPSGSGYYIDDILLTYHLDNLTNWMDSPGIVTGGVVTTGTGAGTFKVEAITAALLRTSASATAPLVSVTLAEQDSQAITAADTTYYVIFTYGTPCTITTSVTAPNSYNAIPLGKVMKDTSNNVHFVSGGLRTGDGVKKLWQRAKALREIELMSGNAIAYSGTNNFTMTEGKVYAGGNLITQTAYDSATTTFTPVYTGFIEGNLLSGTDIAFVDGGAGEDTITRTAADFVTNGYVVGDTLTVSGSTSNDGSYTLTGVAADTLNVATGLLTAEGAAATVTLTVAKKTIDFAHYDNAGTLTAIANNKYGCFWVYRHVDDGDVYVRYGKGSYSLADAETATEPAKPTHLTDFGCLIGKIIAPQAGGSFAGVQMVTDIFFTGTSVSDHANLSNLDYASAGHTGFAASGANSDITSMTGLTTPLGAAYGGTGVANGANNTITFTGNYTLGLTLSANTAVTLPTSGTLATLAGTETFTNKTVTLPIIKGTSASDLPSYSAEFLDADNWTSVDWTGSWAAGWDHTTGNLTVLSHDHNAVNATPYQITYTVTGRTAGTFVIGFGGQTSAAISATGAWGPTTTSTAVLTITPTTDFDGAIVISIKSITAISTPAVVFTDSGGTTRMEIRINMSGVGEAGLYNTFVGKGTGESNTTGSYNTFFGYTSGRSNTTGNWNTFVGEDSGYLNTVGYSNTFMGYGSGHSNVTGFNDTFIGQHAGRDNTTGSYNTFVGRSVAIANTTGSYNSFFGYAAGLYNADWSSCLHAENSVYIGANTKAKDNDDSNSIVIGYNATSMGANTSVIGNSNTTDTYIYGNLHLPTGSNEVLLSTTTVAFNADADTTLYTVPTGKRCVLSHAIVVAAGDAGATTTLSIGQDTAETDFIPANTLSNLDAQYDAVILQPIPNTTPLKIKSYAAATVIQAQVATQSGVAGNTIYLFGILY